MRKFSLFLGIWYLVMGLGIPFPAPSLLPESPAEAAVAQPGFPCSGHSCGCSTAEDCRRHCCCFPSADQHAAAPEKTQDVFSFAQGLCQGEDPAAPAGVSPRPGSHLPVEIVSLPRDPSPARVSIRDRHFRRAVPADPSEKIPI